MNINSALIRNFSPCKDRIENFETEYPGFNGELSEFLNLDKITYIDKVWVCVRVMTKTQLVKWSILCAESTLHYFERMYPDNKRPRALLEHLKTYESFENLSDTEKNTIRQMRGGAYDAAYDAACAEVYGAAYASEAASSIAYAAVATTADYSAEAAQAAASAACAAAYAAIEARCALAAAAVKSTTTYNIRVAAHFAREEQQNLNLLYLTSVLGD